jgi:hypothetical protein
MAILGLDALTGCSSIPSFLGGSSDTPSNPSKMIFHNTNAPTSWVKDTTHNNKSLRVIGGANGTSLSNSGTNPFTTVFSPRTDVITSSSNPANATVSSNPAGYPTATGPDNGVVNTITQPSSLSAAQNAIHNNHLFVTTPTAQFASVTAGPGSHASAAQQANNSGASGPGGGHSHPISGGAHTHPVSVPSHTHPVSNAGPHSHQFTLSQNFDILYVDIIVATKS